MARYEFKLPDLGEGVAEGEIVTWLIAPGDVVREDQPMVEVMTDKATVTISAPKSGSIVETRGAVGEVVRVHSVLVVFELDGAVAASAATAPSAPSGARGAPAKADGPAATAVGDIREDLPGMSLSRARNPAPAPAAAAPAASTYFNAKPLATPATRKLARDLAIDLSRVPPTGPAGRVSRDDVRGAVPVAGARAPAPSPVAAPAAAREPIAIAPARPSAGRAPGTLPLEERTPLKGMRKRIFENMARSKHTAAHFTFVEECDVTELKALQAKLAAPAAALGAKLSFLPFIVKAVVAALKKHPSLNAAFDESTQEIVTRRTYNIGIAASTDAGLVVPVVKDADQRSLVDLAVEIARLGADAKAGRVKLEDLQGGTFTITSLGKQGGLFATPIINFPEVAVLGVHQMKQKPVVRDGAIVIGDVMLLSLSFDHRLIDGHVGAAFAYEVIAYLEHPERLLLELA